MSVIRLAGCGVLAFPGFRCSPSRAYPQFFVDGDTRESAWPTVFDQLIAAAIGEGEK